MENTGAKIKHKCPLCKYDTFRKFDLKRHQNSKHPVYESPKINVHQNLQNVYPNNQNVHPNLQNIYPNKQNVHPNLQSVHSNENNGFLCKKCNKHYKVKKNLIAHESKCNGIDILTCPKCMLSFSSRKSKSNHIKRDNCKAKIIPVINKTIVTQTDNIIDNAINNKLINLILEKDKKLEILNKTIEEYDGKKEIVKSSSIVQYDSIIINGITITSRSQDNYINATLLCQAGGKLFGHWYSLNSTKELIKELKKSEIADIGIPISANNFVAGIPASKKTDQISNDENVNQELKADIQICISANDATNNFVIQKRITKNTDHSNKEENDENIEINNFDEGIIPSKNTDHSNLIKINKSGNKYDQYTWIHPDLAIQLAQWISPIFALQVSKWIRTLLTNGSVSILEENAKLLEEKDKRIKLLENTYVKKHPRKNYNCSNVIYMLTTKDYKKQRIYIIGKATNLKNRLTTYNKTIDHDVVFYKSCNNENEMNAIETIVLLKLNKYQEVANRDRFILPLENDISLFTNIINETINIF